MASAPLRTILFYGAPHPITRAIFEYLRAILAIDPGLSCELVTGGDRAPAPGEIAIYIRAEATDAAALAAMTNLTGPPTVRRACALVTALDARWGHLPRLSIEATLNQALYATSFLAEHGVFPIDHRALAAARDGWRTLRRHPSATDDPLGFFGQVDIARAAHEPPPVADAAPADARSFAACGYVWLGGATSIERTPTGAAAFVAALMASHESRNVLVLSCDAAAALHDLRPHLPASAVVAAATIDGDAAHSADAPSAAVGFFHADLTGRAEWPAPAGLDLVHLHHAEHSTRLADVLPWARARLSTHGLISGAERSADAVRTVVSALADEGRGDGIAFALDDTCWKAVPGAYWSA